MPAPQPKPTTPVAVWKYAPKNAAERVRFAQGSDGRI